MNSALFIDGDNIQLNQDKLNLLFNKIKKENNLIIKKIYLDWKIETNKNIWSEISKNHGLEEIQVTRISGKNSTDNKIIVDIMKYLYTNEYIEKVILIGCDKDYIYLIQHVLEFNKKFDVYGLINQTSQSIINICSTYYDINEYVKNNLTNKENINKDKNITILKLLYKYIPKDGISEKKLKRKIRDKNINELNKININEYLQNKNYFKLINQNNKIIIFKN